MRNVFDRHITCAFLYSITRYGYPPDAEHMVTYVHEMADLGFQSIELEGIGEAHLKTVYKHRKEIKQALEDRGVALPVFCTVLPGIASPQRLSWKVYWDNLLSRMDTACKFAADYGLNYYMHPCVGSLTDTTNGYLLLKEELGWENLKFNFDTSNLYYMHENLSLGLLKLGKDLDYIHISDSYGQRIEHQAAGNGTIDWDLFFGTLKQIGFSGELSIDVGGDESHVADIDEAYLQTARFLEEKIAAYEIY